MIHVEIPGSPVAQGRPRFVRVGKGVRTYDPPKAKKWKRKAAEYMTLKVEGSGPAYPEEALTLEVVAVFPCPKSDHRVNNPPRRRLHTKRPDLDNVVKAVKDAGDGILWADDSQICKIIATKEIAAQGEEPFVAVFVYETKEEAP